MEEKEGEQRSRRVESGVESRRVESGGEQRSRRVESGVEKEVSKGQEGFESGGEGG